MQTSTQLQEPTRRRAFPRGVLGLVEEALRRQAGMRRTLVVTVPAPHAEPEAFLASCGETETSFWDGGDGTVDVGIGAAHRLSAAGPGRFAEVRRQASRVGARLASERIGDAPLVRPRFYGGLAFGAGSAAAGPWKPFGDADFLLPRYLYRSHSLDRSHSLNRSHGLDRSHGDTASLSLAVRGEELGTRADVLAWVEELDRCLDTLAGARPRPSAVTRAVDRRPPDTFVLGARIDELRREIRRGTYRKVVVAHRTSWAFEAPPDPVPVLRRLHDPELGTRFAFRRDGSTFLGATPEHLVTRTGRRVLTEALAGTARGRTGEAALLASAKDRHEHRLVVESIVRRLAPFARLDVAAEPRVKKLRHLIHLQTPIAGKLTAQRHVLELGESLHPTPAVGGLPVAEARRWIAAREPSPRGWYAGPVGWFDAKGDGELVVALRSALLAGREAHVYAGAGIVADSETDREIREIDLKQQTLKTALLVA